MTETAKRPDDRATWALRQIEEALRGLQFGQVTVIVQDGVVIQVEHPLPLALGVQPGNRPIDRFRIRIEEQTVGHGRDRPPHLLSRPVVDRHDDLVRDVPVYGELLARQRQDLVGADLGFLAKVRPVVRST